MRTAGIASVLALVRPVVERGSSAPFCDELNEWIARDYPEVVRAFRGSTHEVEAQPSAERGQVQRSEAALAFMNSILTGTGYVAVRNCAVRETSPATTSTGENET
jgi:hypothetical protein